MSSLETTILVSEEEILRAEAVLFHFCLGLNPALDHISLLGALDCILSSEITTPEEAEQLGQMVRTTTTTERH